MRKPGFVVLLLLTQWGAGAQEIFQKEIFYDPDSLKLREVLHFTKADTVLHGSYESFHLNGSLQTLGYYQMGQPDSIWTYYYENGRKRAQGRFSDGITNGKWSYYFENGHKKSEGLLHKDIKQGTWNFYYENGRLKSSGTYYNDRKQGMWDYYYEDDLLKAQAYYEEGTGIYKEFYPSGGMRAEGQHKNEKSEGGWTYYYETGELQAFGSFDDGLRVGEWTYYHKNGQVSAIGTFEAGKEAGVWKHYYPDGRVSAEGAMESGEKDGFWKLYYPTGEVKGEGNYQEGNGEYKEYYPNGTIRTQGQIVNGQKYGKWSFYTEEGVLDGEAMYKDGEGIYTGFYPNGSLKMKGVMSGDRRVGDWELYNADGSLAGTYKPIYEEEDPLFKGRTSRKITEPTGSDKPDYLYKNNRLRYFTKTINEYEGIILGTNPLQVFVHRLPVALEYYKQERLGYELQFTLLRDPFFTRDADILNYEVYTRGGTLELRQKFYHQDRKLGMWWFGHQVGVSSFTHSVRIFDEIFTEELGELNENRLAYSLLIGNRWIQHRSESGLTVDAFVGVGAGVRLYTNNYSANPDFDRQFAPYRKRGYFPITFGLNIGIMGSTRKQQK